MILKGVFGAGLALCRSGMTSIKNKCLKVLVLFVLAGLCLAGGEANAQSKSAKLNVPSTWMYSSYKVRKRTPDVLIAFAAKKRTEAQSKSVNQWAVEVYKKAQEDAEIQATTWAKKLSTEEREELGDVLSLSDTEQELIAKLPTWKTKQQTASAQRQRNLTAYAADAKPWLHTEAMVAQATEELEEFSSDEKRLETSLYLIARLQILQSHAQAMAERGAAPPLSLERMDEIRFAAQALQIKVAKKLSLPAYENF